MDSSLPNSEVNEIEAIVRADERVLSFHDMRTRKSGAYRHVDMHIVIAADTTLIAAHHIADELEQRIAQRLDPAHVVIHVDPYEPTSGETPDSPIR
jgi:divalent metal cation (Fe/Co/Zn/Cd) transporter